MAQLFRLAIVLLNHYESAGDGHTRAARQVGGVPEQDALAKYRMLRRPELQFPNGADVAIALVEQLPGRIAADDAGDGDQAAAVIGGALEQIGPAVDRKRSFVDRGNARILDVLKQSVEPGLGRAEREVLNFSEFASHSRRQSHRRSGIKGCISDLRGRRPIQAAGAHSDQQRASLKTPPIRAPSASAWVYARRWAVRDKRPRARAWGSDVARALGNAPAVHGMAHNSLAQVGR